MDGIQKTVITYAAVGLVGTVVVGFCSPFVKAGKIRSAIIGAQSQIRSGKPADALVNLARLRRSAALYPCLASQVSISSIKAHAALDQFREAEAIAEEVMTRGGPTVRGRSGLVENLQVLPISMLKTSMLQEYGTEWRSPMQGYSTLITLLKQRGEESQLEGVARAVLEHDKDNKFAIGVLADIAEADRQRAALAAPPSVARKKPVVKKTDHYVLAKQYAARRLWDHAARECDMVLKEKPKDARALALRRRIEIGDAKWAIVKVNEASVYNQAGKHLRKMTGGTFVEVNDLKKTRAGTLAVCAVSRGGKKVSGFLMRVRDLHIRTGRLSDVSEDDKAAYVRETQLTVRIASLKARLLSAASKNNPFTRKYAATKSKYNKYWKKVEKLKQQRDSTTGDEHMKYADELRKMKGEDIVIGTEYENAKKKFADWNRKNSGAWADNPDLAALEDELDGVAGTLRASR